MTRFRGRHGDCSMLSPHEVLGLSPTASEQEVKEAYRRLAKKFHPDLVSEGERHVAEKSFKQVSEAYAQLTGRTPVSDWQGSRSYYSSKGSARARGGAKFSNATVALILLAPLTFTGVFLGRSYENAVHNSWRPNGLFQAPINEFLRDDALPQQRVWGAKRVWPRRVQKSSDQGSDKHGTAPEGR